jgi:hypothetical protein
VPKTDQPIGPSVALRFILIQAEEMQLHGLVESLSRKNRHLGRELSEAHRANEEQFGALMKAQAERVSRQHAAEAGAGATRCRTDYSSCCSTPKMPARSLPNRPAFR